MGECYPAIAGNRPGEYRGAMDNTTEKAAQTNVVIQTDPVPLRVDEDGVLRIADTRLALDHVIEAYLDGATPEGIVDDYDFLRLADVYAVIAYYLNHRPQIDAYLHRREEQAEEMRRLVETMSPPRPRLREELLARLARKEAGRAAAGE